MYACPFAPAQDGSPFMSAHVLVYCFEGTALVYG